jgi:hypothetical protein
MSAKNHYTKRNQELNQSLMKRWGFSIPETTTEPVVEETPSEEAAPEDVAEHKELGKKVILEAAVNANVELTDTEIQEVINEMIEEGLFDDLKDLGAATVTDPLSKLKKKAGEFVGKKAKGLSDTMARKKVDRITKKATQDLAKIKQDLSKEMGKTFLGLGKIDFERDERLGNLRAAFEMLEQEISSAAAQFANQDNSESEEEGQQ